PADAASARPRPGGQQRREARIDRHLRQPEGGSRTQVRSLTTDHCPPMTLTFSTMLELGTPAPDFSLRDVVSGTTISLATFADKEALLVLFICRHCPFVRHVQNELARIGRDYAEYVGIVGISSNDAETYEDDRPESLKKWAREYEFTFPVCYDATQNVAKAYTAACTPD